MVDVWELNWYGYYVDIIRRDSLVYITFSILLPWKLHVRDKFSIKTKRILLETLGLGCEKGVVLDQEKTNKSVTIILFSIVI